MKKFILNLNLVIITSIIFLVIFGYFLEYRFSKDVSDRFIWQRKITNKSYDYAFIGSSRTMNMIDINLIDSVFTTEGINLGLGGVEYRTLYMVLYSFLEYQNNKIKEIYIQVDPFMLYKDSVYNKPLYDHYFYSISNNEEIYDCFDNKTKIWFYRHFPILKYIEFNKVYNLTHFFRSFSESSPLDKSKGSDIIYETSKFNPTFKQTTYTSKLDIENFNYLKKILRICLENNIKPVLYTAPIYNFEEYYEVRYPDFKNLMKILSNNSKISYFDYVNIFSQQKNMFKDIKHLNYIGTLELTKLIIKNGNFKSNGQ